jgi:hypothetical protein
VAQLRAARKAAQDRLGGRMGRLRQEFRARRATERDLEYLVACYGCVVGESAQQTALGRARRDVMSLGGFGPLGSDLDPARWRTAPVDPIRPYMAVIGAR